MEINHITKRNNVLFFFLLLINVLTLIFWIVSWNVDVYKSKVGGIFFEMVWLPAILCIVAIPIVAFIFWCGDKFKISSKFFYLFVWSIISVSILYVSSP